MLRLPNYPVQNKANPYHKFGLNKFKIICLGINYENWTKDGGPRLKIVLKKSSLRFNWKENFVFKLGRKCNKKMNKNK